MITRRRFLKGSIIGGLLAVLPVRLWKQEVLPSVPKESGKWGKSIPEKFEECQRYLNQALDKATFDWKTCPIWITIDASPEDIEYMKMAKRKDRMLQEQWNRHLAKEILG